MTSLKFSRFSVLPEALKSRKRAPAKMAFPRGKMASNDLPNPVEIRLFSRGCFYAKKLIEKGLQELAPQDPGNMPITTQYRHLARMRWPALIGANSPRIQQFKLATIRNPSSVRFGSTALITGKFRAMRRAYPPVATTRTFRPLNSCSRIRSMISRTRPR